MSARSAALLAASLAVPAPRSSKTYEPDVAGRGPTTRKQYLARQASKRARKARKRQRKQVKP